MYRCSKCEEIFEEPMEEYTTYEAYYGVSSMFPNSNSLTLYLCPNCGEEGCDEISDEEVEKYEFQKILRKKETAEEIKKFVDEYDELSYEEYQQNDYNIIDVYLTLDDEYEVITKKFKKESV